MCVLCVLAHSTNPNLVERQGNFSTGAAKSKRNKGQLGIHFQSDYGKKNDRFETQCLTFQGPPHVLSFLSHPNV